MAPNVPVSLDPRAVSGITGTISIVCWVVVFSPQIISNWSRRSAEGVSIGFVIIWLIGDLFNVVGSVLQGVLSTMIILAVYYTVADFVLLLQCLYYRRHSDSSRPKAPIIPHLADLEEEEAAALAVHFNPSAPLLSTPNDSDYEEEEEERTIGESSPPHSPVTKNRLRPFLVNTSAVLAIICAGIIGWFLSPESPEPSVEFDVLGQIFGYLCAVFYVASRVPQILLNAKRKSCEGVSLLFFIFACLGNATFLMSIFLYVPHEGWKEGEYAKYIGVNSSWILGAAGTLVEDLIIFYQFFAYEKVEIIEESESDFESDAVNGRSNGNTYGAC